MSLKDVAITFGLLLTAIGGILAFGLVAVMIFCSSAHSAGCVPRNCTYTGHERICDCA